MALRWGIAFVFMAGCYFESPTHPIDASAEGPDGSREEGGLAGDADPGSDAGPRDAGADAAGDAGPGQDATLPMDAAADAALTDATLTDGGGNDDGAAKDAGPMCQCTAEQPVCLPGTATCVQCSADIDGGLGACSTLKPYCSAGHACVECTEALHCPPEQPVCASNACDRCGSSLDCAGRADTPVCDADGGACVECNLNTDCQDPDKPTCDNHVCRACQMDSECAGHAAGATVLDACVGGQCLDCRVDAVDTKLDHGCGGGVACDPATHTCTGASKSSVDVCLPCVADSECKSGMRCVEMFFASEGSVGGYCLLTVPPAPGCPQPYSTTLITRESLSGAVSTSYCGVTESVASCAAIKALEGFRLCPGSNKSACDAEGALCETVSGTANRCTYACSQSGECPASTPCDGPAGAKYCGGSP